MHLDNGISFDVGWKLDQLGWVHGYTLVHLHVPPNLLKFLPPLPSLLVKQTMLASRATAPFVPTWQPFNLQRKQYSQQYTHVYSKRLLSLAPIVKAR